jgi:hypothetical protein
MEHSGVYRPSSKGADNKVTKKKFGCFNAVGAKPKESKFTYMAKSYVTSINNAREPNAAPRSLFNMEFMSRLSKKEPLPVITEAPRQRPVESAPAPSA